MTSGNAPEGWWQDFVAALPARTAKLAVVRADGRPHVAPVWIDLDRGAGPGGEDVVVFMTGADTVKGKAILRDGRVALCIDDDHPPFSMVTISGHATVSTDLDSMLEWSIRIAGRYMGAALAESYGRRNAVPGELLVRVTPTHVVALRNIAD